VPRLKSPVTRGEVGTTLALVVLFVGLVVSRPIVRKFSTHPSSEVCAELLDRYVEHVVHAAEGKPLPSELAARKAQARNLASEDRSFAECPKYLTRAEAECAMRAGNADEFERCLP